MRRSLRVAVVAALAAGAGTGLLAARLFRRSKGEYFDSAGVRLHFTDEGSGEPLILLHGFAVNADLNWRLPGLTGALRREFRVIAPDLRGHGLSGKPHDAAQYGRQMVLDVLRLMDHLGLAKAHVAGYSLGGFITLKLAAESPERLLTASVLGAGWERPDENAFLDAAEEMALALESGRGIGPIAARLGGTRAKPSPLHTFWVWVMTRYLNDGRALAGVVRGTPELAVSEEDLARISVPLCVIIGSRDPMLPGAEALRDRVPQTEFTMVPGADHLQAPRRRELRAALLAFLRRHRAAGGPA